MNDVEIKILEGSSRAWAGQTKFAMNDSSSEDGQRIEYFKEAIRQQWKCRAKYRSDKEHDLSCEGYGKGKVYVFELSDKPEKFPEASKCFVWNGEDFEKDSNATVIMLDAQVPSHESERLPELAVWYWCKDHLLGCRPAPVYTKSTWTKGQLDGQCVWFNKLDLEPIQGRPCSKGKFFVREQGGEIAVYIIQSNGQTMQLYSDEIERIKESLDSVCFWVKLS